MHAHHATGRLIVSKREQKSMIRLDQLKQRISQINKRDLPRTINQSTFIILQVSETIPKTCTAFWGDKANIFIHNLLQLSIVTVAPMLQLNATTSDAA